MNLEQWCDQTGIRARTPHNAPDLVLLLTDAVQAIDDYRVKAQLWQLDDYYVAREWMRYIVLVPHPDARSVYRQTSSSCNPVRGDYGRHLIPDEFVEPRSA